MICKRCKKEISDVDLPCPFCGYDSKIKLKNKNKLSFIKLFLIAFCLIIVIGSVFFAIQITEYKSAFSFRITSLAVTTVANVLEASETQAQTVADEKAAEPLTSASVLNTDIVTYPINSEKGVRAETVIEKSIFQSLTQQQFKDFCQSTVQNSNYSWFTVKFNDSTGIVFLDNNISVIVYGKLDNNALVSEAVGYIIKQSNGDYLYLSVSDSQTQAAESESITEQTTAQISSDIQATTAESSQTVYVTASGTKFHKISCSYLSKSSIAIERDEAVSKGYTACTRCNP